MNVSLRKAKADDGPAVCALATALIGLEADRRASFDAVLANPDHDLVVAEVDGAVWVVTLRSGAVRGGRFLSGRQRGHTGRGDAGRLRRGPCERDNPQRIAIYPMDGSSPARRIGRSRESRERCG
jgi:hypothetical protein